MQFASALVMVGSEAGCRVSLILKLVDGVGADLVVQKLASSSVDAVLVHCISMVCLHVLYQV